MQKFYVSLVRDLLDYYIEFDAQSELAVRQYLMTEYFDNGNWKLPWCSVYKKIPDVPGATVKGIIKATCGPLYEWNK